MARLCENAAIAQQVERILGKDEVASSNLASSSKKERPLKRVVFSFFAAPDLKDTNATRMSVAGEDLPSRTLILSLAHLQGIKCKQIWLAALLPIKHRNRRAASCCRFARI